jgi:hypothetical protein
MHPPTSAYRATTFRSHTFSGTIDIRIDQAHPQLDLLHRNASVQSWCFITAYNPRSNPLSQIMNERRQEALREAIASRGLAVFEGEGIGDDGTWPAEPSFLVLGISRSDAMALGRQFDQAAIVVGDTGGPAELLFCDPRQPG